jgi:WD40 repeat protein
MGPRSEFVVSGSDDGRAFVWERDSGRLVNLLVADEAACAVATPHPALPMLATAGSEGVVRLWAPTVRAHGRTRV